MNRQFDVKIADSICTDINKKAHELETEWLSALLLRMGVSKIMIDKALNDDQFSSGAWRDYLFDFKGITIVKHLQSKDLNVYQISFETSKKIQIGGWEYPNIIRKKGKGSKCQLVLKYWQIL